MTPRQRAARLLEIAKQYGEQHALDLAIACPVRKCAAGIAQECIDPEFKPAHPTFAPHVHFGRRLKRLLAARQA